MSAEQLLWTNVRQAIISMDESAIKSSLVAYHASTGHKLSAIWKRVAQERLPVMFCALETQIPTSNPFNVAICNHKFAVTFGSTMQEAIQSYIKLAGAEEYLFQAMSNGHGKQFLSLALDDNFRQLDNTGF
jgi:hypothetical protein